MGSPTPAKPYKHMIDEIRVFQNEEDVKPCKISYNLENCNVLMTDAGRRAGVYKKLDKGKLEKTNVRVCLAVAKGLRDPVSGLVCLTLGKPVLLCIGNFRIYVSFGLKTKQQQQQKTQVKHICDSLVPIGLLPLSMGYLVFLEFSSWEEAAPDSTHNYFAK